MGGALALAVIAVMVVAAPTSGYKYAQPKFRWSGDTISYFNKVKKHDEAVRAAVSRWNHSGLDIHFRRVGSAGAAEVVVKPFGSSCGFGYAFPQLVNDGSGWRAVSAEIQIGVKPLLSANTPRECKYMNTLAAAHEFGHVLGLDHENRRCALLNSTIAAAQETGPNDPIGGAPGKCRKANPGTWFCRVLTADDLKGVKRLYGGGHFRVHKRTYCPIPGVDRQAAGRLTAPRLFDREPLGRR